ncbi:hypothetical protein IEQ34_004089 [Dendrobium chrysotoxum]|uniref:Uncharacterized protein n=1 Tax=Dendrobium chrysotoxum TaxID=161865 RepID=A0AAV7HDZ3_DENCH|nr:hypothetical protein IEQ34_004089 [Dendrobium chrysotoxum]
MISSEAIKEATEVLCVRIPGKNLVQDLTLNLCSISCYLLYELHGCFIIIWVALGEQRHA